MRRITQRFVPDGLPVTANRYHILRLKIFLLHQRQNCIGKQRSQFYVQLPKLRQSQLLALTNAQNRFLQFDGDRPGQTCLLRHHVFINSGKDNIDSVKTGAGHNTDIATRFHALSLISLGVGSPLHHKRRGISMTH
ncbi:hypothetical protein D3C71_1265660 [compost metagenome]